MAAVGYPLPPSRKIVTNWDDNNQNRIEIAEPADLVATCKTHMELIERLFHDIFGRYTVNHPPNYTMESCIQDPNPLLIDNAFWDNEKKAVFFGHVRDSQFAENGFIHSLTATAHEFGHAFLSSHSPQGLNTIGQTGALNESIADVLAIMVKHFHTNKRKIDHSTDWGISEGIFRGDPKRPLYTMTEPLIDNASRYYHCPVTLDRGGVHINSGIPNRAFAIAAYSIGGPTWETIGKIWVAGIERVEFNETFAGFAQKTVEEGNLVGSDIGQAVNDAWEQVGIKPGIETIPPMMFQ